MAAVLGVVVIGRNEGERLRRCLLSLAGQRVVYVDSGSSDGSQTLSRSLGAELVDLDLSRPFTAARARNAGLARLLELEPGCAFVQFVDGDCEVDAQWLAAAQRFLESQPKVAAVCGRLRERHPERSVYNRLADLEWDRPGGDTAACGGIALMRVAALSQVCGFDATMVAGEEPELCARLRAAGWRIHRLPDAMALHDADMHRFSQWWKRACRGGYAMAQTEWVRRTTGGEPPYRRERARSALWAGALPLVVAASTLAFGWPALLLALAYPLQIARLALRARPGHPAPWTQATFAVLARFAELRGQWQFWRSRKDEPPGATRFDYKT